MVGPGKGGDDPPPARRALLVSVQQQQRRSGAGLQLLGGALRSIQLAAPGSRRTATSAAGSPATGRTTRAEAPARATGAALRTGTSTSSARPSRSGCAPTAPQSTEPHDALLQEVRRTAGHVAWLNGVVTELLHEGDGYEESIDDDG